MADEKKPVDARALNLSSAVEPKMTGDPKQVTFKVEKLPEGTVEMQVTQAQIVSQSFNITDKKGNLIALAFPTPEGDVKVFELTPKTTVKFAVFKDKDAKTPIAIKDPELADYAYGNPVNWMKAADIAVEKLDAAAEAKDKTAKGNAYKFLTVPSGIVGQFGAAVEEKRLVGSDGKALDKESTMYKEADVKLSWDPISLINATKASEDAKKAEPKKEEPKKEDAPKTTGMTMRDGLPIIEALAQAGFTRK